ncbi:response regulator [Brevundimonas sp.]|uniref:response regulator n=1 Tax=Brevundimonas sp. TaxID=1871086 RepID=UPI0025D566F1|nr:response regulator [Brevundimonas sp.]
MSREELSEDAGRRVLVVDDNPHARQLIASVLRAAEVRSVSFASNGAEGLRVLADWAPDAIIADLEMEPIDGLKFTRAVRAHDHDLIATIPIVMVTSRTDLASVMQARDAGVDEFVAKPITVRNLVERFEAALLQRRDFVRTPHYVGPCRRRRAGGEDAPARRFSDGVL